MSLKRKQALPRWLLACISLLYHIVLDHGCTPNIVRHIHHVHLPSVPEKWRINSLNISKLSSANRILQLKRFSNFLLSYPSSESVVLILLISRNIMFWVSSIPAEFIFFMCWYVYILKISSRRFGWAPISCFSKLLLFLWF